MTAVSGSIQKMYTQIDQGYELVNHLFSFYLDVWWRRRAIQIAQEGGGAKWLDLCTGTGETAIALKERAPEGTLIVGADFSQSMLSVASSKPGADGVRWTLADASKLPFEDGTFDLVTISFATRNLKAAKPLPSFFSEIRRVLAPGGRFVHLETSRPPNSVINFFFRQYVRASVVPLGTIVTGAAGPYRFLTSSVLEFHGAEELSGIMRESGFSRVEHHPIMLGGVAIHVAEA